MRAFTPVFLLHERDGAVGAHQRPMPALGVDQPGAGRQQAALDQRGERYARRLAGGHERGKARGRKRRGRGDATLGCRRIIRIALDADEAAAEQRIAATEPLPAASLAPFVTAREAPRVPFASLIERGLLTAGARLVDAKRRHRALVRADGAITLMEKENGRERPYVATVGSIHRIGALAQGLDACNGWAFWHVDTPKGLVSIDALRAEVRAEMGTS